MTRLEAAEPSDEDPPPRPASGVIKVRPLLARPGGSHMGGRFVGREREQEAFGSLLDASSPAGLLVVHGPVGVGKSWLTCVFAELCERRSVPWVAVDGLLGAAEIDAAFPEAEPSAGARSKLPRRVVLCDVNASPEAIDEWAPAELLGRLSAGTLVVVTSRRRPSESWRLQPEWGTWFRALPVTAFGPSEAGELLERLNVPETHVDAVMGFAGGSPLLLTLAGHSLREGQQGPFDRRRAEDALRGLLPVLGVHTTSASERMALRVCAMARRTTPGMLERVLAPETDVEGVFRWLQRLPVVDDSCEGLRMQDVARRAVLRQLRAHYPTVYMRLLRGLKAYSADQVSQSIDGHRWVACVLYLEHHVSELHHYLVWDDDPACRPVEVAKSSDWDAVHRAVLDHEGERSARILKHWAEQVPDAIEVARGPDRAAQGLLVTLPVDRATVQAHGAVDPTLEVVSRYVEAKGASEDGAWGILHRYWMDLRHYQTRSPVLTELVGHIIARSLGVRNLPFTFGVTRDVQAWMRFARIMDLPAEVAGEFELEGIDYSLLAMDWREGDPTQWLLRFAGRDVDEAGQMWWKRVTGRARASDGGTLRDTMRPGSQLQQGLPLGPGGLGDLIMSRMRRLAEEAELTKREVEVLDLLLLGRSTDEIALVLEISPRTAKFHQANVLRKLGADSRSDLVRLLL